MLNPRYSITCVKFFAPISTPWTWMAELRSHYNTYNPWLLLINKLQLFASCYRPTLLQIILKNWLLQSLHQMCLNRFLPTVPALPFHNHVNHCYNKTMVTQVMWTMKVYTQVNHNSLIHMLLGRSAISNYELDTVQSSPSLFHMLLLLGRSAISLILLYSDKYGSHAPARIWATILWKKHVLISLIYLICASWCCPIQAVVPHSLWSWHL